MDGGGLNLAPRPKDRAFFLSGPPLDMTQVSSPTAESIALCIDLDGTLIRSDLLYEAVLRLVHRKPWLVFALPFWLLRGKAALKHEIFSRVELDATRLPYDERVIALIDAARASGRKVVLCSASNERAVHKVAEHLKCFDVALGSTDKVNLGGRAKAEALVRMFGDRRFEYAGNAPVDVSVWRHASTAIVVGNATLARAAGAVTQVSSHFVADSPTVKLWLRALRLHQWLKNLLIFVPLLASHRLLDPTAFGSAALAFLAFSLCASGVYVINDLFDLDSDRAHPRKKERPFASGALPLKHGMLAAPLLLAAAFGLALYVSPAFAAVLLGYMAVTSAYSFYLKRMVVIDVMVLAGLYTVRIIGGAAAISAPLSFWLLAFSMFIFLSLAMLKRYTELLDALSSGKAKASGRGYNVDDLPLIQSMGAASGYMSVLVLALYINSPESLELYSKPKVLWLLCPILLYWISRAWVIAHRGLMHDDPVVFAAKDRMSRLIAVSLCAIAALAI